ncbi:MAG: ion transporter [Bdellovibrionales bacterium]|nr:ion transporter [Bdellovibrionales bacterium]
MKSSASPTENREHPDEEQSFGLEGRAPAGSFSRRRVWEIVQVAQRGDRVSHAFDMLILALIFLSAVDVVLGSVKSIDARYGWLFDSFEVFSVMIFTGEYLARLWACPVDPRFREPVAGRLRFAVRPLALVDLMAVVPFYLPYVGVDLRALRLVRLATLLRVAKIARYSRSLNVMGRVIASRKEEMALTMGMLGMVLVIASCLVYYCEHDVQPEAFPDIPSTMWWGIVTLTTIGYGDVFPVTALGKLVTGVVAILGIGLFALPAGILGSGFVEEYQKEKARQGVCPHCGRCDE